MLVLLLGQGRVTKGTGNRETNGLVVGFIVGLFGFGCVCCSGSLGFSLRKCLQFNVPEPET